MDPNTGAYYRNVPETMELNENYPINSNQQNYNSSDVTETVNIDNGISEFSGNGAVPQFKESENLECYALVWKYMEQIKSISAGLLLLFCGGVHTVWAIFQVLYYETSENYRSHWKEMNSSLFGQVAFTNAFGLLFTVIMWYMGVIIGCFLVGYYLLPTVQKKNIYYVSALMMFVSLCLFYGASVSQFEWQAQLLFGRLFAGISHGITYITIFIQASENSAKEFRKIMVTVIGGTIAFSIFVSSTFLIYVPIPNRETQANLVQHTQVTSADVIMYSTLVFCLASVLVNYFYSHETVPFLLKHNCRDEDAIFLLAKLNDEESNSILLQNELESIKEMCKNDYVEFPEGKIFRAAHRGLLNFALYGRLGAVQSFNIPVVVMLVKILQSLIVEDMVEDLHTSLSNETLKNVSAQESENRLYPIIARLEREIKDFKNAVKIVLFTWFIFGMAITLLGNCFNWKREIHLTSLIAGITILIYLFSAFLHIFTGLFSALALLVFLIYFKFLSLPVDMIGYTYLTECFPVSTKPMAIAFVTIVESFFHILLIAVDIKPGTLRIEYFGMGLLLCAVGYRLYRTAPDTKNLSLAAAQQAYLHAGNNAKWL